MAMRSKKAKEGGKKPTGLSKYERKRDFQDDAAPEVRRLSRQLGARDAVLDGEMVAFDQEGRPSFERLQQRIHQTDSSVVRRRMKSHPATYVLFDLLYLDSRYTAGMRTGAWLKVKTVGRQELVIGGWVPGEGRRRNRVGSILLGAFDAEGELHYSGKVGTGFSERELNELLERLRPLAREGSPFAGRRGPRNANFVAPELVAEIEFREMTAEGMVRHGSFKGLREDKPARDVRLEHADGGRPVAAPTRQAARLEALPRRGRHRPLL